ncbi:MAG: response regulator [Nitrososphaerales archaeon]
MYRRPYHILVLDDDVHALHDVVTLLQERDYVVVGAQTIDQAQWWLSGRPIDLLIAAVRLRGIGGVQFFAAVRDRYPELAGILIGNEGDQFFETDAWRHGATLITRPYDGRRLLMVVAETLASIRRRQRWPRKTVPFRMPLSVSGTTATLIDVSYGGVRFALEGESYDLPSPMTIEFSSAPLTLTAELVWSSRASDGVRCLCGAAIVGDAPADDWRRFVDRVPQRA